MKISTSHANRGKKPKKNGRLTPAERFQREWRRVQNLQKQNAQLGEQVAQFAEDIIRRIEPVELESVYADYQLAQKLLRFAERKSLSRWQREELLDWIQQILLDLSRHPFSACVDLDELYLQLGEHIDAFLGTEPGSGEEPVAEDEQEFADAVDELIDEFLEQEDLNFDGDEAADEPDDLEQKQDAEEQSLNQLLKSSSINKMFRQIASAIHPDREMDAARKAQRNAYMSELAQARDDKDIPKIFAMYATHVGASPLEFIGEDVDKVVTLLKRQASRLRAEKDAIIHANPLYGMLYQRFYHKSAKKVEQEVNQHVKATRREMQAHLRLSAMITNLSHLKAALEQRAALRNPHEYDDYY